MKKTVPYRFCMVMALAVFAEAVADTPLDNADLRQKAKVYSGIPDKMPGSADDTAARVELGKALYFETALSINNTQSCNTCHNILNGGHGVDNLKTPVGALGKTLRRNAPSTFNAGFQFAQNWDTSAPNLAEQAKLVLLNKDEMALPSPEEAENRLRAKYASGFERAFPDDDAPVTFDNIAIALAAFQRTLITQDRFDQFIQGDDDALSKEEKLGFLMFQQKGCAVCHSGPLMGGQFPMKIGHVMPYPNTEDKGLAEVTGREAHNFLFKVPNLRNVANTYPYFHDGATSTLEEAVFLTGWHQLGQKMNDEEVQAITTFLRSLSNVAPFEP